MIQEKGTEKAMLVSLIAAVAENGVIGRDNDLPWKIREDMRFFVATTRGHTVITGRRNYEAMGRPLPKRRNIVVSRNAEFAAPGCEVVTSVEEALRLAAQAGEEEAFVIGGAQLYELAFPYAQRFYRTRVCADVPGDVFFPQVDLSTWQKEVLMEHQADEENEHAFVVERWERKGAAKSFEA